MPQLRLCPGVRVHKGFHIVFFLFKVLCPRSLLFSLFSPCVPVHPARQKHKLLIAEFRYITFRIYLWVSAKGHVGRVFRIWGQQSVQSCTKLIETILNLSVPIPTIKLLYVALARWTNEGAFRLYQVAISQILVSQLLRAFIQFTHRRWLEAYYVCASGMINNRLKRRCQAP